MEAKDTGPEPYSNEWYRRRLNRIDHNLDRQDNELLQQYEASKVRDKRIEKLESEKSDMAAKVGELTGKLEELMSLLEESTKSPELKAKITELRKTA